MLNIASVNMPKIKPETKVLIIKSKSPAEVADIFNVSKRQVERIRKHCQETGDTEVPGRSVRWMVTLIVPNINRFLPPSTFPTTRGVRFFNRVELLAIPQVPLWSFSGGRRSRSFRDGQHSLQIWILLSISGEDWRRKLGGPIQRTWRSFGMPARYTRY